VTATHTRRIPGLRHHKATGHTKAIDFGPVALKAGRQRMIDKGSSRRYINHQVARINTRRMQGPRHRAEAKGTGAVVLHTAHPRETQHRAIPTSICPGGLPPEN